MILDGLHNKTMECTCGCLNFEIKTIYNIDKVNNPKLDAHFLATNRRVTIVCSKCGKILYSQKPYETVNVEVQ